MNIDFQKPIHKAKFGYARKQTEFKIKPWGVKLLWLHSVLHTPFSPSLLYLPSKHLNVWCVVYFTNRAKKYIYIYIYIHTYPWYGMVNVDRVIYRWKTFNSLPGTYLWHARTSPRSVSYSISILFRSNEPTLPPLLFIYRNGSEN